MPKRFGSAPIIAQKHRRLRTTISPTQIRVVKPPSCLIYCSRHDNHPISDGARDRAQKDSGNDPTRPQGGAIFLLLSCAVLLLFYLVKDIEKVNQHEPLSPWQPPICSRSVATAMVSHPTFRRDSMSAPSYCKACTIHQGEIECIP